jgi:aminoglycoside 3-N-acetyltransferase
VAAIRDLDLTGRSVCVHCSLQSFGHLSGGAESLVSAFLGEGCTLIVPSFSWGYAAPPPDDAHRPAQNGTRYDFAQRDVPVIGFDTTSKEVDRDMGALSIRVTTDPERVRGSHPLCSFSALGPMADELLSSQRPDRVWAPLERLVEDDGAVVLMGVDLTRLSLVHLAEQRAGRRPFIRWARSAKGGVSAVEVGSCSDGFGKLAPCLRDTVVTRGVGESCWTSMRAKDTLDRVTATIKASPSITRCSDPGCDRCRDAVAGGPLI